MLDELRAGPRAEDIAAAKAALAVAKADVQRAETALSEMVITAPMDGLVESIDVRAGDLVRPGAAVRMVNPDDLELNVYVSAAMLGHLQVGQEIPFTTDSHGGERFTGAISHIASEGEFTPRNLQTEEERVQQVFKVVLKFDSAGGKLRAGMSATAHLDVVRPKAS
jgi:HlyD family secretion protein